MPPVTKGRIVFFHFAELVLAALVCKVFEDGSTVNLAVFGEDGQSTPRTSVPYSEDPKSGCWSWPPRTVSAEAVTPAPARLGSPPVSAEAGSRGDARRR